MNLSQWFRDQLQVSADGFVWGTEQVPPDRRNVRPPLGLGKWTAARHAFHLMYYEKHVALPSMRQWLGELRIVTEWPNEKASWGKGQDLEGSLQGFREVRNEQITLLPEFDDAVWNEKRQTMWEPVTLSWVVGKTYQHTTEHTSNVMRIALFWDYYGISGFFRRAAITRDARKSR